MSEAELIRSVRDQITNYIRDDLLSGRVRSGERLSEAKLAERFGVSRGPIRESLVQLASEGLLVSKPNCGVTVAPEPPDDIRDLIVPIRRTIETYALKLSFDRLTEADFRQWDEELARLERACSEGDEEAITLHDIAFHRGILTRAGQADLLAIWQMIVVRVRGHFQQAVHRFGTSFLEIHAEHQRLVEVFRTGDLQAAVTALADHIW